MRGMRKPVGGRLAALERTRQFNFVMAQHIYYDNVLFIFGQ